MARILADSVATTSTTAGTGDLVLASSAPTGHRTPQAVMATNDTMGYRVAEVDGNGAETGKWEVGVGTYLGSNNFQRTTVIASSNANLPENFGSGTKRVYLTALASDIAGPNGVRVKKNGAGLITGFETNDGVALGGSQLLCAGYWGLQTQATSETLLKSITIPAGTLTLGKQLRIMSSWTYGGNNTNNKQMLMRLGHPSGLTGGLIMNRGRSNAQGLTDPTTQADSVIDSAAIVSSTSFWAITNNSGISTAGLRSGGTINFANDCLLTVSGYVANAADFVKLESLLVEVLG